MTSNEINRSGFEKMNGLEEVATARGTSEVTGSENVSAPVVAQTKFEDFDIRYLDGLQFDSSFMQNLEGQPLSKKMFLMQESDGNWNLVIDPDEREGDQNQESSSQLPVAVKYQVKESEIKIVKEDDNSNSNMSLIIDEAKTGQPVAEFPKQIILEKKQFQSQADEPRVYYDLESHDFVTKHNEQVQEGPAIISNPKDEVNVEVVKATCDVASVGLQKAIQIPTTDVEIITGDQIATVPRPVDLPVKSAGAFSVVLVTPTDETSKLVKSSEIKDSSQPKVGRHAARPKPNQSLSLLSMLESSSPGIASSFFPQKTVDNANIESTQPKSPFKVPPTPCRAKAFEISPQLQKLLASKIEESKRQVEFHSRGACGSSFSGQGREETKSMGNEMTDDDELANYGEQLLKERSMLQSLNDKLLKRNMELFAKYEMLAATARQAGLGEVVKRFGLDPSDIESLSAELANSGAGFFQGVGGRSNSKYDNGAAGYSGRRGKH